MPPLPVVPATMKLVVSGHFHDSPWLNIFHVQYSGTAPDSSEITNYLETAGLPIQTAYTQEMSVDNHITGLEGVDLASDMGAQAAITFDNSGARTGDFTPSNVALVASCEINRRYRGGHPRKYFPWGTAGTYATGSTRDWDSGFVADCQSNLDTMVAGMVGITEGGTTWTNLVNVSYRSGGAVRSDAVVDPILSWIVRTRICSQRRRLGKVGG